MRLIIAASVVVLASCTPAMAQDVKPFEGASGAQTILEKMEEDELAAAAMIMLDWDGREFSDGEDTWFLEKIDVLAALRTEGDPFEDAEIYVRDAFDHLFWHLERIQHQIDVGLITLDHVWFPTAYLFALMETNGDTYRGFLAGYSYTGCMTLWDAAAERGLPAVDSDYDSKFNLRRVRKPSN